MDQKKSVSSSSSSFDHLFGPIVSPSSSSSTTGLFHSIFPQPSMRQPNFASRNGAAIYQPTNLGIPNEKGGRSNSIERKSNKNEETQPPCNLSSSIYYGGQDNYYSSSTTYPDVCKKDGEEEDNESASRGNWWKGSFYY